MRMTSDEVIAMAKQMGAKDVPRVVASVALAIKAGDDPQATFDSVRKWNPKLFGAKPASPVPALPHWTGPDHRTRKQRRAEYQRNR